jgi:hypothetical protein
MPKQTITIHSIDDLREGDVFGGFVITPYCGMLGVYGAAPEVTAPGLSKAQISRLISNGFNTVQREVERYTVEKEDSVYALYEAGVHRLNLYSHDLAHKIATALNKLEEAS